ncbi:MAG: carboxypeptidase-like regulatory domain-containing protein [Bacteroidales bacterium]|nr:carboxypeptidase-like regulatory domain-containing protein [Bacteroidales bacterium]
MKNKLMLKMKLTAILLLISFMYVSAEGFSQDDNFNILMKNAKVQEVLEEIRQQSNYEFLYNNEELKKCDKVNINVKNGPIEDVLQQCFAKLKLSYQITDNVIIIKPDPNKKITGKPEKVFELTQTVRGRVVDKESQIPLPGATVIILGTKPLKVALSDSEGYFRIEEVSVGRYNIQVSYIGYKEYIISEIQVTTSKELVLNIQLEEEAYSVEEVVIKVGKDVSETQNSMSIISARTFSAEDTRRYAGGVDDPARMASAFAGVAVGNIQDNSIIVRGNSPKGVLWRLEGVDIPCPSHFAGTNVAGGGFATLFSNHLLANSDFFTGAFPAEYGNALAGVFDIRFRNGNNQKREYAFQAGVLGIDFAAEGPFVKGKRASYLFNYRYSTFGLIKHFIPSEEIPKYQDLSFKLNFPLKKGATLSFWGVGGIDVNLEPVTDDTTKWTYNWDRAKYEFSTNTGVVGLTYKKIINNSSYIHSALVASTSQTLLDIQRMSDNLVLRDTLNTRNIENKYTFTTFLNKKFSKKHTNRTGIIFNNIFYDTYTRGRYEGEMIDFNNSDGNSYLLQVYSQSKYHIARKLLLNLGVHAQYFFLNEKYSTEPRAGLKYKINQKNTLSIGYGNHSQTELLKIYLYQKEDLGETVFPNKNLNFSKAHHFVIGYDYFITPNLRIKLESYYQYLYNIPVVADDTWSMINYELEFAFDKILVNEGKGTNIGVDFTFERFFKNNYYYLVTASVFDSKYTGGNGEIYNSRFNKSFVVNLLGGKEFIFSKKKAKVNILGINGRLSVSGGHRLVPVDEELSLQAGEIYYDWSNPFEEQNPTDFFLDLTLTYRINKKRYSSVWALQIKNVTGRPSNFQYDYNIKENKIETTSLQIIVPSISYKIEF